MEGPLVVNEICSWAKKNKKKIILFKVDFDKVFDSLNWDFLDSNLVNMEFGNKMRMWLKGCLVSSKSSILVNGCPTEEISISKGVKQGDPFSPFLYVIAM